MYSVLTWETGRSEHPVEGGPDSAAYSALPVAVLGMAAGMAEDPGQAWGQEEEPHQLHHLYHGPQ